MDVAFPGLWLEIIMRRFSGNRAKIAGMPDLFFAQTVFQEGSQLNLRGSPGRQNSIRGISEPLRPMPVPFGPVLEFFFGPGPFFLFWPLAPCPRALQPFKRPFGPIVPYLSGVKA